MAHGGKDWSTGGQVGTVHTIEDLGELAARLKSIDTFDRRGNVILLDDFESGIEGWEVDGNPAGWTGVWTAERHRNGGFSLKLTTKPEDEAWVEAFKGYPYPTPSRLGFEFNFIYGLYSESIEFFHDIYDGSNYYRAYVRFIPNTKRWQYLASDGVTWTNLDPAYDIIQLERMFHTVKLVVDMTTGKYSHLIVNDHTFDMSKISMYTIGSPGTHRIYSTFKIIADRNDTAYTYIDDFIGTINEP